MYPGSWIFDKHTNNQLAATNALGLRRGVIVGNIFGGHKIRLCLLYLVEQYNENGVKDLVQSTSQPTYIRSPPPRKLTRTTSIRPSSGL